MMLLSRQIQFLLVFAASGVPFLSGCGGGGGGSSGPNNTTPIANFQPAPAGTNLTLRAPDKTQTMDAYSILMVDPPPIGIRPTYFATGGQLSVTFSPSVTDPTNVFRITTALTTGSLGLNGSQTFSTGPGLSSVFVANGNMDVFNVATSSLASAQSALFTNALTSSRPDLSYQLFGIWTSTTTTPNSGIGVFSVGNVVTPSFSIPTAGTAVVYSGTMLGYTDINVNAPAIGNFRFLTADVNASVDFANRSIVFSTNNTRLFTDPNVVGTSSPSYNLAGTLNWTSGTNSFQGVVSNASLTGSANGRFYGPNAEELGGVLQANDGTRQMVGAFGAAK